MHLSFQLRKWLVSSLQTSHDTTATLATLKSHFLLFKHHLSTVEFCLLFLIHFHLFQLSDGSFMVALLLLLHRQLFNFIDAIV